MRIHEDDKYQGLLDELEYFIKNPDDMTIYSKRVNEMEAIANKEDDKVLKLAVEFHHGNIYFENGDFLKCRIYMNKALEIAKGINQAIFLIRCYNILAIMDSENSDFYSSISNYSEALKVSELYPEYKYGSMLLNNIGNLFVWLNEHEVALDYLWKAYNKYIEDELDDQYIINVIYLNIVEECSILKLEGELKDLCSIDIALTEDFKLTIRMILSVNEIEKLYKCGKRYKAHDEIRKILNDDIQYDNYIYVFRSYLRLFDCAICEHDKEIADNIAVCLKRINENSHINAFQYDYVILKHKYFEVFQYHDDVAQKAPEILNEYARVSENYIAQMQNAYTRRLTVEAELSRIKNEKENINEYNLQLKKDIELDLFTKIYNKISISKHVDDALKARLPDVKQAIMLIDIDYFKDVNDTFGHDFGDSIILQVVEMINTSCNETTLFGRFGGDEFILFMKSFKDTPYLVKFLNHLLDKVREIKVDDTNHITISIGVYVIDRENNFTDAFTKVDSALYGAKGNGRNGYYIYDKEEIHTSV